MVRRRSQVAQGAREARAPDRRYLSDHGPVGDARAQSRKSETDHQQYEDVSSVKDGDDDNLEAVHDAQDGVNNLVAGQMGENGALQGIADRTQILQRAVGNMRERRADKMVDQAIQLVARWYNDGKQLLPHALDFVKRAVIENYLAAYKGFGELVRFLRKVFPATMAILKDVMTTVKASSPGENVPGAYPKETEVPSIRPDASEPERAKVVPADPTASYPKRSHSTMAAASQPARVPGVSPVRSRPILDRFSTPHPVLRAMLSPIEGMNVTGSRPTLDGRLTADPVLRAMRSLKGRMDAARGESALDGHPTVRPVIRGVHFLKEPKTPTRGKLAPGGYWTAERFPRGTYLHQGSDQINKKARSTEPPTKSAQDIHQLQPLGDYWTANLPAILGLDGRELPVLPLRDLTPSRSEICRRFVQSINPAYEATGAMVLAGPTQTGLAVRVEGQDLCKGLLITAIWNDDLSRWTSVAFRDELGNPTQKMDPTILKQLQCNDEKLNQSMAKMSIDDDPYLDNYDSNEFGKGLNNEAIAAHPSKKPFSNPQEDVIMAGQESNNDDGGDGGGGGRAISTNVTIPAAQMAASVQGSAQTTGHGAGGTDAQRKIAAPAATNAQIDSVMSDASSHENAGDHTAASSSFDFNFTASAPVPTFGQGAAQGHPSIQPAGVGLGGHRFAGLPLQNQDSKIASTQHSLDSPHIKSSDEGDEKYDPAGHIEKDTVSVDGLCEDLAKKKFNSDEGDGNGNISQGKRNGGNMTSQSNNSRQPQQQRRRR